MGLLRSRRAAFDIDMAAARGDIPGTSIVGVRGNIDTLSQTYQTIWPEGGIYVFPTSASTMTVSSDDAADDFGSTGATIVRITYLDSDYVEANEIVILDGLTAVTTTASILRIVSMLVVASGSGNTNAGAIRIGTGTVTSGVPANVFGCIQAGKAVDAMAFYTVPAGKTLHTRDTLFVAETANKFVTFRFVLVAFGTADTELVFDQIGTTSESFQHSAKTTNLIPEKSDFQYQAIVDAGMASAGVISDFIQTDNA